MIGFLTKRLANKILAAIVITIVLIMGTEIVVRIYFGTRDRIELMNVLARDMASSTYAGIKHPMAVGDAEGIKRELLDIRETVKDIEVFICNFDQEIIYSTHEEKVKTKIADSIRNKAALETLSEILKNGIEPQSPFEEEVSGQRYLVSFYPILNQKGCHHCHGSSRKVIGTMAIRITAERVYATVGAQRNRTLVLTLFGIPITIIIIHLIVHKFIRRPVENLAEKAHRFAEGDMSVSIDIKTEDEIGVLGKTFNYMIESVSSASRKLEEEINRKTALLDERTRLITLVEKANRKLRELDKLKSTFLANMSHELRTPMNAIIGDTDLLEDGVDGPINEEQKKSLKRIANNSRYLLQLINDILDISKICLIASSSPWTKARPSSILSLSVRPFSFMRGSKVGMTDSMSHFRSSSFGSNFSFPDSILDISRMSFISCRRYLELPAILLRLFSCSSLIRPSTPSTKRSV